MYLKTIPLLCFYGMSFCQKATVPTGGDLIGPDGSTSYTIGQLDYTSLSSFGSINEGVQQPHELFILQTVEWNTDFVITAYPNPVVNSLTINSGETTPGQLVYVIIDENGSVVMEGILKDNETKLDVRELASSVYFLNIMFNDQEVKSYKLIKRIE